MRSSFDLCLAVTRKAQSVIAPTAFVFSFTSTLAFILALSLLPISFWTYDTSWGRSDDILGQTACDKRKEEYMRYDVVIGALVVLFFAMGIAQAVRIVKRALGWHRQTREAAIRANIAAAEIQKMLSGRARTLSGWR